MAPILLDGEFAIRLLCLRRDYQE